MEEEEVAISDAVEAAVLHGHPSSSSVPVPLEQRVAAASVGALLTSLASNPLDVVKTRLQVRCPGAYDARDPATLKRPLPFDPSMKQTRRRRPREPRRPCRPSQRPARSITLRSWRQCTAPKCPTTAAARPRSVRVVTWNIALAMHTEFSSARATNNSRRKGGRRAPWYTEARWTRSSR